MSILENKTVFVAGGSGMAGRAIINEILTNYKKVKIRAAVFSQGDFCFVNERVEVVRGDLRDPEECRRMCSGCDFAIMAAALTGGAKHNANYTFLQINANANMNMQLLQAFHEERIKRVLLIGSATCYQEFDGAIAEGDLDWSKDPNGAHFGIGWVTRFIEKVAQFWNQKTGMEIVMVRASNIFGPFAQFDPARSNFIPALIRKAVKRMDPFEVWGNPEIVRDVIYSETFASACLGLLNREDIKFDVFNIGSGVGTKVSDVVDLVLKQVGYTPVINYVPTGHSNLKMRILNCDKLKRTLTNLDLETQHSGISKTIDWWENNHNTWKR